MRKCFDPLYLLDTAQQLGGATKARHTCNQGTYGSTKIITRHGRLLQQRVDKGGMVLTKMLLRPSYVDNDQAANAHQPAPQFCCPADSPAFIIHAKRNLMTSSQSRSSIAHLRRGTGNEESTQARNQLRILKAFVYDTFESDQYRSYRPNICRIQCILQLAREIAMSQQNACKKTELRNWPFDTDSTINSYSCKCIHLGYGNCWVDLSGNRRL